MEDFVKPNVVVSKCLGFAECRYDGISIADNFVDNLKSYVNFIPVCPEVEIGLSIPRPQIKIVYTKCKRKLLQPATGKDITEKMTDFVNTFLSSLKDIDGFILKSKSPSCGLRNVKIFANITDQTTRKRGAGFFGGQVAEKFSKLAIEDERRLKNLRIRERFLTRLFTLARFREIKKSKLIRDLIQFHSQNKYLLMAYNQKEMRILGRIVANPNKQPLEKVLSDYETHLKQTLRRAPRYTSHINVLMHALGYLSKNLTPEEKSFFLKMLEKYRNKEVPLSTVVNIMKAWINRFKNSYLMEQTFFNTYPEDLIEITEE